MVCRLRHVVAGARFLVEVPFFEEEDFFAGAFASEAAAPALFDARVLVEVEAFPAAEAPDDLAAPFFGSVFAAVAEDVFLAVPDDFFLAVDVVWAHRQIAAHASTHAHPKSFRIVFLPV